MGYQHTKIIHATKKKSEPVARPFLLQHYFFVRPSTIAAVTFCGASA
jgi:hypothetical protein